MTIPPSSNRVELSGFEVQRRLGAGGMAEVFLAKKRGAEGTHKELVVKRILPEHSASRRFRHMFIEEAQLATRLNHPNIVQVYEFSDHGDDGLLLSMEYVEGVDLGRLIRAARKKQITIGHWVSAFITAEVAKGLHFAHERKDEGELPLAIVHRDVSPQNILVSFDGIVKIADFGIASANLFRQESGVLKGKVAYMSPEQARGDPVDRRSDVYALGVVYYEMLTGQSPYGSLKDTALREAVRHGAGRPVDTVRPDVPAVLADVAMRATLADPEKRFQSARDMAAALARALIENQRLVDHTSVEEMMVTLLGSEKGAMVANEEHQATMAEVRRPKVTGVEASGKGTPSAYESMRVVREVRHVAVILLQLKGFEALQDTEGRVVAQRVVSSMRSTLNDIAYKHGAVWSWESETSAHAVTGLTNNPGRAPNDAAAIARDVHEFLTGHSEDLSSPIRASVALVRGIAAGKRDDQGHLIEHELHNPASYLARELVEHTPAGQTWVAGGVYRLIRRQFRWQDGAEIELRQAEKYQVPDRMRVHVLLRPLTAQERLAELELSATDLVGREAEKGDLHAAYHRAVYHPGMSTLPPASVKGSGEKTSMNRASGGEMLARVVVGEMGIGKTALVETFLEELPPAARVYRVECSPVKSDLPYATVSDLLREATGVDRDDSDDDALSAFREQFTGFGHPQRIEKTVVSLTNLVIGRPVQLEDADAASEYHDRIVTGVRYLFGALARSHPIVIVIDSLQWADRASLELLKRVLSREETLPVLTVLLTRPDERVAPYIEGLMRNELGGLKLEQQVRLVQARLGVHAGVAEVCRELVPRVGGNPFFLLEMIDALLERGALEIVDGDGDHSSLVRQDQRWDEQADTLPSTIEQLVGDRLSELPPAEHDVIDWLAVAGGPLSHADMMVLTRLVEDEPIMRLCARGLCEAKGEMIDFRHPLTRDVAYQSLDKVQRARMHRGLGEHLRPTPLARGLSAAIIARHFEKGEAPQKAAELYTIAAKAARGAHQAQLALRYYHSTLELLPDGDRRRLVAHEALDRIYRHLGRSEERRQHLGLLRKLSVESREARWIATALVHTAQHHVDEGKLPEGLPIAQRAADVARYGKQTGIEVEALILLCELLRDLGDVNGALEACERGLQVAESNVVSRRTRAEVLRTKGVLLRRAGQLHAAVETHAAAMAVFKSVGARRSEARARNALGFVLFVLGRYQDCIAMCLSSVKIDVMIGGRFQIAKTLANIGVAYGRLGATAHGLRYLDRAREAHERYRDHDAEIDTLLVRSSLLLEVGRLDEAKAAWDEARSLGDVVGTVYDRIHVHVVHALIAGSEGDWAASAAHAAGARQLAEGQALVSYHVYGTAIEASARVALGDAHAGVLLATTALGAVEAMEGSEYGIEVRALCCDAILTAQDKDDDRAKISVAAIDACHRSRLYVDGLASYIRDEELKQSFLQRPPVRQIMDMARRFDDEEEANAAHGAGDEAG